MSLEKPISTIKNAIQRASEMEAQKEGLEAPEHRHYKQVLDSYRLFRIINPYQLEAIIRINAQEQVLKNKLGEKLFNEFNESWDTFLKFAEGNLADEEIEIKKDKKLTLEKLDKKLDQMEEEFLQHKIELMKHSPRLSDAFSGKDQVLNDALEYKYKSMLQFLKFYRQSGYRSINLTTTKDGGALKE